jgi:hypothetical protein
MSALTEVGTATVNPLAHIWNNIVSYLPGFIEAIIVILVGYLISLIIGNLIKHILVKLKLDLWVKNKNLSKALLNIKLSNLTGQLVKWGIFISFLVPAANLIRLPELSNLINSFAMWIPNLILAVIILCIGVILATLVSRTIYNKYHKGSQLISDIIRVLIIIVFLDIALNQIGVQLGFVESVFLIIIGAILLVAAIVIGIAFGKALKKPAEELVSKYFEDKNKKKKSKK